MGLLNFDHIKRLIALTGGYIKRLSLSNLKKEVKNTRTDSKKLLVFEEDCPSQLMEVEFCRYRSNLGVDSTCLSDKSTRRLSFLPIIYCKVMLVRVCVCV